MPGNKDIELSIQTADHPLLVRGDQIQLQQVCLNLMLNARDALRDIADREKTLEVRLFEAAAEMPPAGMLAALGPETALEKYVLLTIADNGCGMDERTRKRLFEPFFTTKPVGQGTGMGLAMAYGTVSNHHGVIFVDSALNQGTTVYILLPLLH